MNHWPRRRKFLAAVLSWPLAAAAGTRTVALEIVARKPRGGVRTVRIVRGETLTLSIRADESMTVHVHGYDLAQQVTARSEVSMTFVARRVGRFPVSAHLPGAAGGKHAAEPTLLYLEVHPE